MRYETRPQRIERARSTLRTGCNATAIAGTATVLGAVAHHLAAPLGLTTLVCGLATAWLRESYYELLERLATDRAAHDIPEVARFVSRIGRWNERRRLASLIENLLKEAGEPGALGLPDRLAAHTKQLEEIAHALDSVDCELRAHLIASCRRLLIRAAQSPLYNERIPADELAATLHHIHAGLAGWWG